MKRILLIVTTASLVMLLTAPCYSATEIILDKVDGLFGTDTVFAGVTVRFTFRWTWTPGDGSGITGFTTGFKVWTHQNGLFTDNFSPIVYDTLPYPPHGWLNNWDGGFFPKTFGVDGIGQDTVAFGGFSLFGPPGVRDPFDQQVWWVETTPLEEGDTLCVDSSWYPPANTWLWSTNGPLGAFPPDWDGPHCFHVEQCCIGDKGNVDMRGLTNIADLTFLKAYLFHGGPAPPCTGAGDVDGLGDVNVADLTYLIDYLFRGGPVPPPCP